MDSYSFLKSLHLIGVVLFIGNIIVTGFWKVMADRNGTPSVVAFSQRLVTLTDWIFTFGGSTLVGVAAVLNVVLHDIPVMETPWLRLGGGLFAVSAVIWVAILVPLQCKLGRLAKGFANGGEIPPDYWRLERLWLIWGTIDILVPMAVIPVMVFK